MMVILMVLMGAGIMALWHENKVMRAVIFISTLCFPLCIVPWAIYLLIRKTPKHMEVTNAGL